MIKNIKKIFLAITALGAISPILMITLANGKLYLTLLNFGFKGALPVMLIVGLSLYPFYLNEKMQDKLAIIFNFINLFLVIASIFVIRLKVTETIGSFGILSGIVTNNLHYSWGIILMIVGVLGILTINIYELYTIKKNIKEKE